MKDIGIGIMILMIAWGGLSIGRLSHLSAQNARLEATVEHLERENEALKNQLLGSYGGQ